MQLTKLHQMREGNRQTLSEAHGQLRYIENLTALRIIHTSATTMQHITIQHRTWNIISYVTLIRGGIGIYTYRRK